MIHFTDAAYERSELSNPAHWGEREHASHPQRLSPKARSWVNALQRKVVWATRRSACGEFRNWENMLHRTLYEVTSNPDFDYADFIGPDQFDSILGLGRVAFLGTRRVLSSDKCQASIATWKRRCTRTAGRCANKQGRMKWASKSSVKCAE